MKNDIYFKSNDNITNIHGIIWKPENRPKVIIQIVHGMCEYIERYNDIAEVFTKSGILVCGHDHLGHGSSVIDSKHYGYFAKKNASQILVEDTHTLTKLIKEQFPNTPIFILGHSMGSFVVRNYISQYGKEIRGSIIMGTAYKSTISLKFAKLLTNIIKLYKGGEFYRSKYIYDLVIGKNNKYFEENNPNCWLTRDYEVIKKYSNDPKCQFRFTINANYTLFDLIENTNKKKKLNNIPKKLPILIISGKDDPVGNFGKDIDKLYNKYLKLGLTNVKMKLYNNMRHEILNEIEKEIVFGDIINYINDTIK